VKAISYRVFSSIITGGLVFSVTGKGWLAVGFALFDSVIKTLFYYLHERLWTIISYGRRPHPLAEIKVRQHLTEGDKKVIRTKLSELGLIEETN
jgi:uncharacterized membrane protein